MTWGSPSDLRWARAAWHADGHTAAFHVGGAWWIYCLGILWAIGATDTQGEAPKFWVVETSVGRWHSDDGRVGRTVRRFALLKCSAPEAGSRTSDILRHEAAYLRVARLGVESLYSIAGILDSDQRPLTHHEVLIALHDCVTDFDDDILENFRRDILNLAMGNRDARVRRG